MNEFMRQLLFLPRQVSSIASEIDQLHYFVITVTMLGATAVTLVGGFYLIKYRSGARGAAGDTHRTHPENGAVEPHGRHVRGIPLWAELSVVFGLLGLFVLFWFIGFDQFARMRIPPEKTFNVYVTGKQWMWNFAYTNGTGSSGTMYVPAQTPVKLIITSRDVIHSFFVPEFRLKMDAVPGRFTTLWFEAEEPGTYPILCTEYCGMAHSTMRGEVVVVHPSEWSFDEAEPLDTRPLARGPEQRTGGLVQGPPMIEVGERAAAEFGCLRCHTTDGTPHIGPTWAGLYGSRIPLADGEVVVADEAFLTESMMDPVAKIHRGFQPVMPSYFGSLPAAETAAIVEYIKALRDVRAAVDDQAFTPRRPGIVPLPELPDVPVEPLRPVPAPRLPEEEAPYPPPGTDEFSP